MSKIISKMAITNKLELCSCRPFIVWKSTINYCIFFRLFCRQQSHTIMLNMFIYCTYRLAQNKHIWEVQFKPYSCGELVGHYRRSYTAAHVSLPQACFMKYMTPCFKFDTRHKNMSPSMPSWLFSAFFIRMNSWKFGE